MTTGRIKDMLDGCGRKEKALKLFVMKGKRDKIVLIVGGISVKKIWLMTQTPVLVLLNYIIIPYIPKKGFLDTISVSWSIKVFLVAVAVVSPIY